MAETPRNPDRGRQRDPMHRRPTASAFPHGFALAKPNPIDIETFDVSAFH
jgi:hypothetical protein